jgi:hypothetical protein
MKTKQKIRDSRDANDEQASAQHTLNKKTKHEVDESVAESFVVRSSERAARLFASARSLPFRSVLFMQKHRRFVHCFFFFFFLSLFLSFWGRKKKKTTHPLLLLLYPLCSTLDTAPGQVLYGNNLYPQIGALGSSEFL